MYACEISVKYGCPDGGIRIASGEKGLDRFLYSGNR